MDDSLLDGNVSFSFDVADPEVMPDPVVSWEKGESGVEGVLMELKVDQDIGMGKINIVDVLKPDDEPSEEERSEDEAEIGGRDCVTRWVVCTQFKKEQERLAMRTDPAQWNASHVIHWLRI